MDANHRKFEIKLHVPEGSAAPAVELAQRGCAQHGLWLDTVSKAQRGEPHGPAVRAAPLRMAADATLEQAARAVAGNCMEQVLANASEVAAGCAGDEHVHQLRVGLRRLRTALRELRPAFGGLDARWEPALAALFHDLGRHRDAAVLVPALQRRLEAAGGPPLQADAVAGPLPDAAAAVRAPAVQAVLLGLLGWLHAGDGGVDAAVSAQPAARLAARRLRKLYRGAVAEAGRFAALDRAAQHRLRKRFKRLRYLAEFARPLFSGHKVDRFLKAVEPVQQALGEYQDGLAAQDRWRAHAAHAPAAWFGVGWLAAQREGQLRACEAACAAFAKKARPFWD